MNTCHRCRKPLGEREHAVQITSHLFPHPVLRTYHLECYEREQYESAAEPAPDPHGDYDEHDWRL